MSDRFRVRPRSRVLIIQVITLLLLGWLQHHYTP